MKETILGGDTSAREVAETSRSRLPQLRTPGDVRVASARRTPEKAERLAQNPTANVFIARTGASTALPGGVASRTPKPGIEASLHRGLGFQLRLSVAPVGPDAATTAAPLAAGILARRLPEFAEPLTAHRARRHQGPAGASG